MTKLLYIESDPLTGRAYKDRFVEAGYNVEYCDDGTTGLLALARFKPDVVVVNNVLPDMSGAELVRRLRSSGALKSLAIVVFASEYTTEAVNATRQAGANRLVAKGRSTDRELFKAIRESLAESSQPTVRLEKAVQPSPVAAATDASALTVLEPVPETSAPGSAPAAPQSSVRPAQPDEWIALANLKLSAQGLLQTEREDERASLIRKLNQDGQSLAMRMSSIPSSSRVRILQAVLRLLEDLAKHPETIHASNLRTISQTVDFLGILLRNVDLEAEAAVEPFKILAADDSVVARRAVTDALASVDLVSTPAIDGSEALKLAQEQTYDLFVLDVNMPAMSGFELCKALRALAPYKGTPVIFVTACNDFEHRLKFAQTGGDDFIAKPFLPSELAAKALRFLINRRIHQAAAKHAVSPFFRQFEPPG